jgi:hypothetical protein
MYAQAKCGSPAAISCTLSINAIATTNFLDDATPLRIFTPDGKMQKGPDFDVWIEGRKSKREKLEDFFMTHPGLVGVNCYSLA